MSEIPEPKYIPYTAMFGCGINCPSCKEDCYWYREEKDMGAHIPYCACKTKFPIEPDDCKDCKDYHSKYHPTNADALRAMPDEKLAKLLSEMSCCCRLLVSREKCYRPHNCTMCLLDWLKKEKIDKEEK